MSTHGSDGSRLLVTQPESLSRQDNISSEVQTRSKRLVYMYATRYKNECLSHYMSLRLGFVGAGDTFINAIVEALGYKKFNHMF